MGKNTDKIVSEVSERSGGRERSEQSGASERVSGASEQANGRAIGPVLQSVFLTVLDHSGEVNDDVADDEDDDDNDGEDNDEGV